MTATAGASLLAIASFVLGVLNLAFIILNYLRTKQVKPNEIESMVDRRLGRKKQGDSTISVRRSVFEPADTGPLGRVLDLWNKYPSGRFILQVEFEGETAAPPFSESAFTRLCNALDVEASYEVEKEIDADVSVIDGVVLTFTVEETDPRTVDKFADGLLQLVHDEKDELLAA